MVAQNQYMAKLQAAAKTSEEHQIGEHVFKMAYFNADKAAKFMEKKILPFLEFEDLDESSVIRTVVKKVRTMDGGLSALCDDVMGLISVQDSEGMFCPLGNGGWKVFFQGRFGLLFEVVFKFLEQNYSDVFEKIKALLERLEPEAAEEPSSQA